MTARASMTDLITNVRQLISDSSTPYTLSDDELQAILDRNSQYIGILELNPVETVSGTYTTFYSLIGDLEASYTIVDSTNTQPVIASVDLSRGLFNLATGVHSTTVLYLTKAYTYDIYASACEAISIIIAQIKSEYNFSSAEGSFNRSERISNLSTLYEQYKERVRLFSVERNNM